MISHTIWKYYAMSVTERIKMLCEEAKLHNRLDCLSSAGTKERQVQLCCSSRCISSWLLGSERCSFGARVAPRRVVSCRVAAIAVILSLKVVIVSAQSTILLLHIFKIKINDELPKNGSFPMIHPVALNSLKSRRFMIKR